MFAGAFARGWGESWALGRAARCGRRATFSTLSTFACIAGVALIPPSSKPRERSLSTFNNASYSLLVPANLKINQNPRPIFEFVGSAPGWRGKWCKEA